MSKKHCHNFKYLCNSEDRFIVKGYHKKD